MLIRPKSALYLSFPYNFSSKQEALEAKKKFKQVLNENQNEQLQSKRSMTTFISAPRTSIRYYKDSGPSLFHEVKKTYSHSQIQANFSGFKSQTQKPKLHKNQRLKPCRKICRKSIQNMRKSLKTASDQTNFITNVLMNTVIDTPKLQHKQCQQNNVWFTKEGKLNKISTARLGKQNRFFKVNIHEKGIKIEGSEMKKESRETNNTLSSYQFSLNCKSIARNDVKVG